MENQTSMDDQFLKNIHQHIEDNLGNEYFSVEDLAKNAGICRSMLHRKLIKLIGKSASDLITETRLAHAKALLEKDVATASEIAYQVGYKSPSYFNKVFKKHYHVSPGIVRKGIEAHSDLKISTPIQKRKPSSPARSTKTNQKIIIYTLLLIMLSLLIYIFLSPINPSDKSIAVLPLHNLTGHPENDYFVDGMHDALIGELGQIASLRVISRTSTLHYRDSEMLLQDIVRELGVNSIVEGSVIISGDSLRMLVQLIDVFPREQHLLVNEYRDVLPNVLTIQSAAAKDIAQNIKIKLTKKEKRQLERSRTINPEIYKAYLRGMYYLNQGTIESFETGINYLHEAIDKDPGDPFAYAGLALGYTTIGHGQLDSKEAFLRARAAANKAIKLDPTSDEAHTALSILYLYNTWDWALAKESFEKALDKNPNNEIAHAHFAWYYILFNDMKKSLFHAKKAVMIEPFSAAYSSWLAALYYHNKEYDQAEQWANKALNLKKEAPYGNLILGWLSLKRNNTGKQLNTMKNCLPKVIIGKY